MSSSITINSEVRPGGGDQARGLRLLAARRLASSQAHPAPTSKCRSIVVFGGKGGVGRSIIALNLATVLAQRGEKVGLLDASPDLGNIELLCGLNGYWNLPHVINGCRQLDDVLLHGPAGVTILSGMTSLIEAQQNHPARIGAVYEQLAEFEQTLDWLIVDGSGGASERTREFAQVANDVLIVATAEPTAVAEAYSTVKLLSTRGHARLGLLVNQAESEPQAQRILDRLQQAAHSFLQVDLHRRGFIPRDAAVSASVNDRVPFVIRSPEAAASLALMKLSRRWIRSELPEGTPGFFTRLQSVQNLGIRN